MLPLAPSVIHRPWMRNKSKLFHAPMRPLLPLLLLSAMGLIRCAPPPAEEVPEVQGLATGRWHMELDLDSTAGYIGLPLAFDVQRSHAGWQLIMHNQAESIVVDSVVIQGDSIMLHMPFFDSEFRGTITGTDTIRGLWHNHYKGPGYAIPFTASHGERPRFDRPAATPAFDISGDWEVHFVDGEEREPAIGIFSTEGTRVKGSFATETGDLRFLEGAVTHDSLFLSTFNGFQAYLFRAALRNDSLIGEFRSGHRWGQAWYAVRNPAFALANDETMTRLNPGVPVAFSFPDPDGKPHALTDARYQGKAVVVEIMGTWCPNCIDQSRLLDELHAKYRKDGLEVVGLSFERYPDTLKALAAIRRFKEKLGLGYDLLYAGVAHRDSVQRKLPFISALKSYPTTLLIGRDGTVRHIYTGIYGPGTGARYLRYKERMENAIVELLREPVPD